MKYIKYLILLVVSLFFMNIFIYSENDNFDNIYIANEPYYVLDSFGDRQRIKGNHLEALSYYQISSSINPTNPYPYFWMAYIYNQENLLIQAISEINNSKKYKHNFEYEYYNIFELKMLEASIYFNTGDIQKAVNLMESIINLASEDLQINLLNDNKYFKIIGDTHLILLYLNYYKDEIRVFDDIENSPNIQIMYNQEYKSDIISYLVMLNDEKLFNKKYYKYIDKNNLNKYKKIIQNPFSIHEFDLF